MIIYNVTINIDGEIAADWLAWMQQTHIPQVMATGLFVSHKILRLISRQDDESGETYAIQYTCRNMDDYDRYQREFAPALQADTQSLYDGRFAAFRTLLEEL